MVRGKNTAEQRRPYVPSILAASGAMRCGAERRWSTRLVYARLEEAQAREGLPGVRGSTESGGFGGYSSSSPLAAG